MKNRSRRERADVQQVPGLAALAPETVEQALKAGRLVHIPEGWTPIHDSVPSDKAYLILEGTMDVVDGDEVIARVGVGAFVGEMGLVDKALRSARVTATDAVLAIAWPKEDFQKLRQEFSDFDELVSTTARERILENEQRNSVG
jgi:CRP/FNR family transcriptional regulator, cyclic AMP receptor protein